VDGKRLVAGNRTGAVVTAGAPTAATGATAAGALVAPVATTTPGTNMDVPTRVGAGTGIEAVSRRRTSVLPEGNSHHPSGGVSDCSSRRRR
jgi:hypothetical protein